MTTDLKEFTEQIKILAKEAEKYDTCMALTVNEDGKFVTLCLDTGVNTYSEWIKGEGIVTGLIRCQETDRVVGVRLPLMKNNLVVSHNGPIKINEGFLKEEGSGND